MDKPQIVEILKSYKTLVAIRNELGYKYDGVIGAQMLTDMPKGSGLSDPIQQAINKMESEIRQIDKDIKRVNDWLEHLNEEERFYIQQFYFEERYMYHIINRYKAEKGYYLSRSFWQKSHRRAMKKLCAITE